MIDPGRPSIDLGTIREQLAHGGGELWRSLEQLAGTPEFRALAEREFPPGASEPGSSMSRRSFLQLMGASLALAGLTACTQPRQTVAPFVRQPEDLTHGVPLHFATAMPFNGYGRGLVVRSNEGRPTKAEGNPLHPDSLGATDVFAQASVLTLYDPERSKNVLRANSFSTWEDFAEALRQPLQIAAVTGGEGVRILTETVTSPTLARQLDALLAEYPEARWYQYDPVNTDSRRGGARRAFGQDVATRYDFLQADVILSLDSDFLAPYPGALNYARAFAARRAVSPTQPTMNRLYLVEATPTNTGTMADNRLPLRPSQVERFARAVAARLGVAGAGPAPELSPEQALFADTVAADLAASRGRSIVIPGETQPPVVHALAHALNDALDNVGTTVIYSAPVEPRPADQLADLLRLMEEIDAGAVRLLVVIGGNPVYTAPADLRFAERYVQVPARVHMSLYVDETSVLSSWHLPAAHFLESWSDVRAFDGTASIVQPLIDPLYTGRTAHELLAILLGQPLASYDLVRETWAATVPETEFELFWRQIIAAGVIPGTEAPPVAVTLQPAALQPVEPVVPLGGLELNLRPDPTIWDGHWANNAWLQELPKPVTTLTWDNAAQISPRTAERLGLQSQDVVELRYRGAMLEAPIWITPGHADEVVTLHLGYGRDRAGAIGTRLGVNAYLLRTSDAMWFGDGLELVATGRTYPLATTQSHWNMEGRAIVRAATLAQYIVNPNFARPESDLEGEHSLLVEYEYPEAWAMSINLNTCIGCNACTIACQAENNIPVVGKEEVINSREMHWIRVDRYYAGDLDNPRIYHMPVPCMHCEKAPCELVCPVAATVHDRFNGLNAMVYNRCVGTKYCSNNCPYKVRRFNFFQYAETPHETIWMQRNPDVTVRSRGVMEKCTYCVQRINRARINARVEGREIAEDEFTTACAQVCPTEVIVFGNLKGPEARVSVRRDDPLTYALLADLNTQPRTTYMARLTNPNAALGPTPEALSEAHEAEGPPGEP